ncbi:hypothetical protein CEXT_733911 [Caerostris extrusa]|uniref:Uncharacterized protein n=1 Tax=Caerostris extrusa TaxID=172846 RepID=A0AAV4WBS5_CAEEX|nr:hypothetical protein CEXT_733911 [Caerostris extrusa]
MEIEKVLRILILILNLKSMSLVKQLNFHDTHLNARGLKDERKQENTKLQPSLEVFDPTNSIFGQREREMECVFILGIGKSMKEKKVLFPPVVGGMHLLHCPWTSSP